MTALFLLCRFDSLHTLANIPTWLVAMWDDHHKFLYFAFHGRNTYIFFLLGKKNLLIDVVLFEGILTE